VEATSNKHFESFSKDLIDPIDPFKDLNEAQILTENKKSLGIHSGLFIPEEACKNLIKNNIKKFVHPMDQCCESIKDVLYDTIQEIFVRCMKGRNKLKFFLQDKALGILENEYEKCKKVLQDLIDTESSYINYDNVEFQKLKVIINSLEDLELEELHEYQSHHGIDVRFFQRQPSFAKIDTSIKKYMADNGEMFKCQDRDINGKKSAWKVSPVIDFETSLTDADREHIMIMKRVIHCYFSILKNKFKSDVPKYVYHYMTNKMLETLSTKLLMSLKGQNVQLIDLTAEDSTVKEKRDEASNALKNLKKAKKAIKDVGKYNLSIIEDD
jgi:hypothetical protein